MLGELVVWVLIDRLYQNQRINLSAPRRGNHTWGDEDSQLAERHNASDLD